MQVEQWMIYLVVIASIITVIFSLEWERIKRISLERIVVILIIVFFLGTALLSLVKG